MISSPTFSLRQKVSKYEIAEIWDVALGTFPADGQYPQFLDTGAMVVRVIHTEFFLNPQFA